MEQVAAPPPSPPPLDKADLFTIAKGKRTKRYRHHSPTIPFVVVDQNNNNNNNGPGEASSPVLASSEESTTTEDVDIARCLLLLARGRRFSSDLLPNKNKKRQIEDTGTTNAYTCKTCNRSFPSFQALGGHRTSHKKFKIEKKPVLFSSDEEDFPSPSKSSFRSKKPASSLSLQLNSIVPSATFSPTPKPSPSPKIRQCSYCGVEFMSGQALGGHMRKHRGVPVNNNRSSNARDVSIEEHRRDRSEECKNMERDDNAVLCLDLNLPAPAEDHGIVARQEIDDVRDHESNKATTALVLANTNTATTPLVDCHY